MLNDAIHRRGDLDVNVIAVLNDTTGIKIDSISITYLERKLL